MKITDLLRDQHREVQALCRKLTNGDGEASRPQLIDRLIGKLRTHTRLEETIFYPALRTLPSKRAEEVVLESYEEHNLVDFLLLQLPQAAMRGEQFRARMRVLQSLLEQHIEEEEAEVFKLAEKLREGRLEELGDRAAAEMQEIERVNELLDRVAGAARQTGRLAQRVLQAGLHVSQRAADRLTPGALLGRRERLAATIAQATPRWMVDGVYEAIVRAPAVSARARRFADEVGRRVGVAA